MHCIETHVTGKRLPYYSTYNLYIGYDAIKPMLYFVGHAHKSKPVTRACKIRRKCSISLTLEQWFYECTQCRQIFRKDWNSVDVKYVHIIIITQFK